MKLHVILIFLVFPQFSRHSITSKLDWRGRNDENKIYGRIQVISGQTSYRQGPYCCWCSQATRYASSLIKAWASTQAHASSVINEKLAWHALRTELQSWYGRHKSSQCEATNALGSKWASPRLWHPINYSANSKTTNRTRRGWLTSLTSAHMRAGFN